MRPRRLALVSAFVAVAAAVAGPAGAAQQGGQIRLVGAPALIDSNIGAGGGKHHFNAVVQVSNTILDVQNLTVAFDITRDGKPLRSETQRAGIRPGGGVVVADVVLPPTGAYAVKARFVGFERAFTDDVLSAAKIVGAPRMTRHHPPRCSLSAHVQNPAKGPLDGLTGIDVIALRQGKIVAVGTAPLFDDLAPGATATVRVDDVSCMKADELRAYVEGAGI